MCSSSKWSEVEPEYCSEQLLEPSADVIVAAREQGELATVDHNKQIIIPTFCIF